MCVCVLKHVNTHIHTYILSVGIIVRELECPNDTSLQPDKGQCCTNHSFVCFYWVHMDSYCWSDLIITQWHLCKQGFYSGLWHSYWSPHSPHLILHVCVCVFLFHYSYPVTLSKSYFLIFMSPFLMLYSSVSFCLISHSPLFIHFIICLFFLCQVLINFFIILTLLIFSLFILTPSSLSYSKPKSILKRFHFS